MNYDCRDVHFSYGKVKVFEGYDLQISWDYYITWLLRVRKVDPA